MIPLNKSDKIYTILFFKETQNDFVSEVHIKRISITLYFQTLLLKDPRKDFSWFQYFLYKSCIWDKVSLDHLKSPQGTDTLWMVFWMVLISQFLRSLCGFIFWTIQLLSHALTLLWYCFSLLFTILFCEKALYKFDINIVHVQYL